MFLKKTLIDFEKIADQAVSSFFTQQIPLTNAVAKLAESTSLNPEECTRLTQKANTLAVLRVLQNSGDKKAEILLADPDGVKELLFSKKEEAPAQEKTVSFHFPTTRKSSAAFADYLFEKRAEAMPAQVQKQPSLATKKMLLANERNRLNVEKLKEETKAKDGLDFLISEFSKYKGPSFQTFAAEAQALHGNKVVPVLKAMAKALKEKMPMAKEAGIFDDRGQLHSVCKGVLDSLAKLSHVEKDIFQVNQCLNTMQTKINGLLQ